MTFRKFEILCRTPECRNRGKVVNTIWIGQKNAERFAAQWKGNPVFDTCEVCQKVGVLQIPKT
jgi:hypothetical protein